MLLDTNVVSELRKLKAGKADPRFASWYAAASGSRMYLSVISVLEIETGLLLVERRDPVQAALLRNWLEQQVLRAFTNELLLIDLPVVRRASHLHVPDRRPDRDALIAATALVHGLTVVTRNVRDFASLGVPLLNPWDWSQ